MMRGPASLLKGLGGRTAREPPLSRTVPAELRSTALGRRSRSPYVLEYVGCYHLSAPPEMVWSVLEDLHQFEICSTWLEHLAIDRPGLRDGSVLRASIATPLPNQIHVRLDLETCIPASLVIAAVHEDLEGKARLSLAPEDDGTRAEMRWTTEIMPLPVRALALVARPLLRRGQDVMAKAAIRTVETRLREMTAGG
jgi:carbon monoxide dehydrogenase subunit G